MKGGKMTEYKYNQIRFNCPEETYIKLKAASVHKTMNKFICKVLEDYFAGIKPQPAQQAQEVIKAEKNKPIVIIIK